jgi:iron(III) transport system ATP-binding protein
MDEPLANLDPHLRHAMEAELAAFHRRAGVTTLYITHDQREAMALADLVAVMREGRFAQVAEPEIIYTRPADDHVARFIGRSAIVPVTVEAVANGVAQTRLGPSLVPLACASTAATGAGRAVIRPEDVIVEEAGMPATVAHVSYRGGVWEATLDAGLPEPLPVASRRRLTLGEAVPVRLNGGWLLPG